MEIKIIVWVVGFLAALVSVAQAAETPQATPDLQTILMRMEQAQAESHAQVRPYTVERNYQFFANDPKKTSSEVVAQVEFLPPTTKNFTIEKASGSGQGLSVVRKVLQHETEAAKNQSDNAMSRANYDFQYVRSESLNGQPCYVLQATPKRRDGNTLNGQVWVDSQTYLIHRIEGQLSKSPSWWVKDVRIVFDYSSVAGMWLHTATLAVADVRILGKHSMMAQDVKYTTAVLSAASRAPQGPALTRMARARRYSHTAATLAVDFVQP